MCVVAGDQRRSSYIGSVRSIARKFGRKGLGGGGGEQAQGLQLGKNSP